MNKKYPCLKFISYVFLFMLLFGCARVKKLGQSNEYQNVTIQDKTIIIPSDIPINKIENTYKVPKVTDNKSNVSDLPPEM